MKGRFAVEHTIETRFAVPVRMSTQWVRLRPAEQARATVKAESLRIRAEPHFVNFIRDAFENVVARIDLPEPVSGFAVDASLLLELADADPFAFLLDGSATRFPFVYERQLSRELSPYLRLLQTGPCFAAFVERLPAGTGDTVERLFEVLRAVSALTVESDDAAAFLEPECTLARRAGSPASLAWLMLGVLRALGLATRFVRGYRVCGENTAPVASLHAWVEVYLPGASWIGLDPATGLFTDDAYVPLCRAPDALRTLPISGFHEAAPQETTERIVARWMWAAPMAKPVPDTQWVQITAVARAVDAKLEASGVRLAVGREVAFVSGPHGGAAEWRTSALGPTKRTVAEALADALVARVVPGAVIHLGQGEWIGGEPLPRWRLSCVSRVDGMAVWRDPRRLGGVAPSPPCAAGFARTLARALGVSPASVVPAFEDPLARRARAEPVPSGEDLADPVARLRLVDRRSDQGRGLPCGWVLPLAWSFEDERWWTAPWRLRRGAIYLTPGTSAMGFRLPLASLPATDPPIDDPARSVFAGCDAFGDLHRMAIETFERGRAAMSEGPAPRTAVCVEVRCGRLHVFVPPLGRAEGHFRLCAAIEVAAEREGVPVVIEGYEPVEDPRVRRIVIAPDAGVLRVTLPPIQGSESQRALLDELMAEAAALGLCTQRSTVDGGSDWLGTTTAIVLGGPTPDESPFLRRPSLVRDLVVHWQRHPSLSYLFSGGNVGASGDAPRVDEGRVDALAELTIALQRFPEGEVWPPWLAARLLRHVLADRVGDARHTEWSIERLYPPEEPNQRLGQLITRTFGAPACARTATLQTALLAALVERFTVQPARAVVRDWNGALHDRFLLPSVLWADFARVLADLAAAGHLFERVWFEPFLDALSPLLGRVNIGDIGLELRSALEPLPLLAEETSTSGVARFVDSAKGRLEVRVTGASSAHVLLCNGRRVPLRDVGEGDAQVGGVRYQRGHPPATLHARSPAVVELVFDVLDTWSGRAIGGCRFVPSPPAFSGAVGMPSFPPVLDGSGPPRRLPVIVVVAGDRRTAGRFSPTGNGSSPIGPIPEPDGRLWSLDLTCP